MKIQQKLYTESDQSAIIETTDERVDEIVLSFGDIGERGLYPKLFLTTKEALELSIMLKSMADKTKTNSL